MELDDFLPTLATRAICTLTVAVAGMALFANRWLVDLGLPVLWLDPLAVRVTIALAIIAAGAVAIVVLLVMHVAELKRAPMTELPRPTPAPTSFWETAPLPMPIVLDSKQERILVVLTEKAFRSAQLAKKIGIEAELMNYHLQKLEDMDLVMTATGIDGTFWKLTQPGREYLVQHGLL